MTDTPRWGRALVRAVVPGTERATVLGELDEQYRARVAAVGVRSARVWYRRQALGYALPAAQAAQCLAPDEPRRQDHQAGAQRQEGPIDPAGDGPRGP